MSYDIYLDATVDTGGAEPFSVRLYSGNVTYNVFKMYAEAGCRDALKAATDKKASELIEPLESGLAAMRADPDKYKALNPSNGWGSYEGAMKFLDELIAACRAHPKATIGTWQ